jgi:transcriptional regulator with XRE-family HTH domain
MTFIFSSRIKELRLKNKISQKTLALKTGVSSSLISEIEHARSKISLETLINIADFFDVSTDYILGRTDEHNSHK